MGPGKAPSPGNCPSVSEETGPMARVRPEGPGTQGPTSHGLQCPRHLLSCSQSGSRRPHRSSPRTFGGLHPRHALAATCRPFSGNCHSLKTGHRVTQTQAVTIPNIVWSHWGQHSQSVTPQLEMTSKHRQQDRLFLSSWCPADAGCRSHGASSGAGPLEACVGVSWGCTRSAWRL